MTRWPIALGVVLLCLHVAIGLVPAWTSLGLAQPPGAESEYLVKAGFLLNFARYVQWPVAAFPTPESPVCIGVLGADPVGPFLDDLVRGETVQGHSLVIRRARTTEALRECHVVFMSRAETAQESKHLAGLAGRPVLTVGEVSGFAQRGGIINFFVENQRVRFEINLKAAERAGLKLNPQLLRLARVVDAWAPGGEAMVAQDGPDRRLSMADDGLIQPRAYDMRRSQP